MSKKLIISLSVVFCVIAVLLILFWTLFGLSSVEIKYDSTTQNLVVKDEEIVKAGEFRFGASVLFEGKKASINKINEYSKENENFAYIRVVNIETVFPNRFVVHVVEREELFAVEGEDQIFICDRDLRVLRIAENFESTKNNAILLKGLKIKNQQIVVGDFLQTEQQNIKKFYSVMVENNRDLAQQIGKFKEITLGSYHDEITKKSYISMELLSFQNRKFIINNIDFAFTQKVQKLFNVESSLFGQKTDEFGNILNSKGEKIYVKKTEKGEYLFFGEDDDESQKIELSYVLLEKCSLKIDNLTLHDLLDRNENDIYYCFVEEGT